MRRLALIAPVLALLATLLFLVLRSGGAEEPYRFAAVFDTAKGMVPGQVIKIAGAKVGKVTDVTLAPGPAARLVLEVEPEHGPFRADASCRILPEGFISENYVDCDPGTRASPELPAADDGVPTVERRRTSVPLALQDVLNVFSAPTPQRLQVLFTNLGVGLSGRGEDLNALLRRSNPSLTQARRTLTILGDENKRLGEAVDATDDVLAELERRGEDVRTFVRRGATVVRTTGARQEALRATVGQLPATLRRTRTALSSLQRAGRALRPTLGRVRGAAPAVADLATNLTAFVKAGRPALGSLRSASLTGLPIVRRARPTVKRLRRASATAAEVLPGLDDLLLSLRDNGGIEALMNLGYRLAAQSAAFDGISHMAGVYIGVQPQCFADPDTAGCSHAYTAPGRGTLPINQPSAGPQTGVDTAMSDARVTATPQPKAQGELPAPVLRKLLERLLK